MAPLLEISDLRTEIRLKNSTVRAVDGISLTVAAGECLGLVGESGCGKTMTARSITRLLPPGGVITSGSVLLAGTDLAALPEQAMRQVRGNDIGMVFQDPASYMDPTMTIGRQIAESVVVHRGADRATAADRALEVLALARVPEPERVAAQYPHHLSGGMRQRAMIAAALACEPSLLIADEPTTALDVTIQREILALLDDLRSQLGMAVILVTHDLGVIAGRADRVAVMYAGRIIEQAATDAVFAGPRHPYTVALLDALPELARQDARSLYSIPGRPPDLATRPAGCSFAARCRDARDFCLSREPALDGEHPGHTYACFFPVGAVGAAAEPRRPLLSAWHAAPPAAPAPAALASPDGGSAEPLLRVSGLAKTYPVTAGLLRRKVAEVSAVAGVNFEIGAGQTFGLVGESGCGKTTIARLLVGLERATAGSILFRGEDLAKLSPRQLRGLRSGIQLMFQDAFASLDPRMRVRSILREPLAIQKTIRRRGHRRQVNRILEEVGLPAEAADRFPREFSGGQRQRLALARALILRPVLIVADEPVSALDVSVQAQILNLMRKLQRQYGLSYLFISHDLSVIRYMADIIGVMYMGKIVEIGSAETICVTPGHPYTAGLIAAVPSVTGSHPAAAGPGGSPGQGGQPGRAGSWATGHLGGELPAATQPPSGCRFRTRCATAQDICAQQEPPLRPHAGPGQLVACHFPLRIGAANGAAERPGNPPDQERRIGPPDASLVQPGASGELAAG